MTVEAIPASHRNDGQHSSRAEPPPPARAPPPRRSTIAGGVVPASMPATAQTDDSASAGGASGGNAARRGPVLRRHLVVGVRLTHATSVAMLGSRFQQGAQAASATPAICILDSACAASAAAISSWVWPSAWILATAPRRSPPAARLCRPTQRHRPGGRRRRCVHRVRNRRRRGCLQPPAPAAHSSRLVPPAIFAASSPRTGRRRGNSPTCRSPSTSSPAARPGLRRGRHGQAGARVTAVRTSGTTVPAPPFAARGGNRRSGTSMAASPGWNGRRSRRRGSKAGGGGHS